MHECNTGWLERERERERAGVIERLNLTVGHKCGFELTLESWVHVQGVSELV